MRPLFRLARCHSLSSRMVSTWCGAGADQGSQSLFTDWRTPVNQPRLLELVSPYEPAPC